MGEGGGGGKEDAGGELAGEDLSQRLRQEGEVLDEVIWESFEKGMII